MKKLILLLLISVVTLSAQYRGGYGRGGGYGGYNRPNIVVRAPFIGFSYGYGGGYGRGGYYTPPFYNNYDYYGATYGYPGDYYGAYGAVNQRPVILPSRRSTQMPACKKESLKDSGGKKHDVLVCLQPDGTTKVVADANQK